MHAPRLRFISLSRAKRNENSWAWRMDAFALRARWFAFWQNGALKSRSDVRESLIEVGDDVFYVFDSNRDAHHAIRDPNLLAHFGRHRGMRHQSGMRNQGFHPSKALCQRTKMNMIQKVTRSFQRAEIERDHAAKSALLALGEAMLRMG